MTDYLKCSFSYSGALLLNNFPQEVRTANQVVLEMSLRKVLIVGMLISTSTRQICKTIRENVINSLL